VLAKWKRWIDHLATVCKGHPGFFGLCHVPHETAGPWQGTSTNNRALITTYGGVGTYSGGWSKIFRECIAYATAAFSPYPVYPTFNWQDGTPEADLRSLMDWNRQQGNCTGYWDLIPPKTSPYHNYGQFSLPTADTYTAYYPLGTLLNGKTEPSAFAMCEYDPSWGSGTSSTSRDRNPLFWQDALLKASTIKLDTLGYGLTDANSYPGTDWTQTQAWSALSGNFLNHVTKSDWIP
jgi:hypothetical protein